MNPLSPHKYYSFSYAIKKKKKIHHLNSTYLFGLSFTGSSLGDEGEQEISSISFPITFSFGSICAL